MELYDLPAVFAEIRYKRFIGAKRTVKRLVSKCSPDEKMRLLAWANLPRYEEAVAKKFKRLSGGMGPTEELKPMMTNAVAAGIR